HPDLVQTARDQFDAVLAGRPNQLDRQRDDVQVTAAQLLDVSSTNGSITLAGVRENVSIGIRYIDSWLRGIGAAAIDNLMEDAATAEISRSQVWQWIHQDVVTEEGVQLTREVVEGILSDLLASLPRFEGDRLDDAADVFREVALGEEYPTFLTLSAYSRYLVEEPVAAQAAA
ncbi:MAG TPA: malate synthase A, partial [Terrimesophilobacter sp.]|nr:malate synthase A [Terrimesophilobacter sp.]